MSCERGDSRTPKFWTEKHPEVAEKIWNSLGLSFQLPSGLEDRDETVFSHRNIEKDELSHSLICDFMNPELCTHRLLPSPQELPLSSNLEGRQGPVRAPWDHSIFSEEGQGVVWLRTRAERVSGCEDVPRRAWS